MDTVHDRLHPASTNVADSLPSGDVLLLFHVQTPLCSSSSFPLVRGGGIEPPWARPEGFSYHYVFPRRFCVCGLDYAFIFAITRLDGSRLVSTPSHYYGLGSALLPVLPRSFAEFDSIHHSISAMTLKLISPLRIPISPPSQDETHTSVCLCLVWEMIHLAARMPA